MPDVRVKASWIQTPVQDSLDVAMMSVNKALEMSKEAGHSEASLQQLSTAAREISNAGAALYFAGLDHAALLCRCMSYTVSDIKNIPVEHVLTRYEALGFGLVRLPIYLNSVVLDASVGDTPIAAAVSRFIDYVNGDLASKVEHLLEQLTDVEETQTLAEAEAHSASKNQVLPVAAESLSAAMVALDRGLRGNSVNNASLQVGIDKLRVVASTLQIGGYGREGGELQSQIAVFEDVTRHGIDGREETVRIASTRVIDVERRVQLALINGSSDVLLSFHSDPRVLRQLLKETLAELKEARTSLGLLLETGVLSEQLRTAIYGLRRVAKALMIAPLGSVQSVLGVLANELDAAVDNQVLFNEPTLLADLATLLSGAEMHLEFLNSGFLPPDNFLSEAIAAATRLTGDIMLDVVPVSAVVDEQEGAEPHPQEFREECREIILQLRDVVDSTDRCLEVWPEIYGMFTDLSAAARFGEYLLCAELCEGVLSLQDQMTRNNISLSAVAQLELKSLLIETLDVIQAAVDEDSSISSLPAGTLSALLNRYSTLISSELPGETTPEERSKESPGQIDENMSEEEELRSIFKREFESIYLALTSSIELLEDMPDEATVEDSLVRHVHTLRGISHTVNHGLMADVFAALESGLNAHRASSQLLSARQITLFKDALARAKDVVDHLDTDPTYSDAEGIIEDIQKVFSPSRSLEDTGIEKATDTELAAYPIRYQEHDGQYEEDMLELYLEEAEGELPRLEEMLMSWESDISNRELLAQIKRTMHTLKGSARMALAGPIGDVTHELEEVLAACEVGLVPPETNLFRLVMTGYDAIRGMTDVAKRSERIRYPVQLMMCLREAVETNQINAQRLAKAFDEEVITTEGESEPLSEPIVPQPAETHQKLSPEVLTKPEGLEESAEIANLVDDLQAIEVQTSEPEFNVAVKKLREIRAQQRTKKNRGGPEVPKLKVDSRLIDHLIDNSAEICVERARLQQFIEDVESSNTSLQACVRRLQQQLDRMEQAAMKQLILTTNEGEHDPLRLEQFSTFRSAAMEAHNLAGEAESVLDHVGDRISSVDSVMRRLDHTSTTLKESLLEARLVTFQTVISRLRTLVRQTATAVGKEADFSMYGENTKVDRQLLESLTPAFEHMIRNAVDHGVEMPETRAEAGKKRKGSISFKVSMDGNSIRVELADDGAGISAEKVRMKAVEKGIIPADCDLTQDQTLQLVTRPGFSTAGQVTQVSGRGVGMDVVRDTIEQLGGSLHIKSTEGAGTTFVITVPFNQGSNRAFVATAGSTLFAIPTSVISRVIYYPRSQLEGTGKRFVAMGSKKFLVVNACDLLALEQKPQLPKNKLLPTILIENGHHSFAILPDGIVGMQDLHIKPLELFGQDIAGLFGISDTVEGELVPVVDPKRLFNVNITVSSEGYEVVASHKKADAGRVKPLALVVDDSIAMRKAEASFLGTLGYEVVTATNGVEAIHVLEEMRRPDVMLVDIEMPKLDGFGLTRYVRDHEFHGSIPIIMITSRSGEQHRQHAMDLGVNVFLGKPFNQDALKRALSKVVNVSMN